jgi:hypothetical protein
MKWTIERELIFDGDRLVGSIVKKDSLWSVEILWSPTMDIKFATNTFAEAWCFVEGVEKTFVALGVKDA